MKKIRLDFEEETPTYVDTNGNFYREFKPLALYGRGQLSLTRKDGRRTARHAIKVVYETLNECEVPYGTYVRPRDGNDLNTHPSNIYLTNTCKRSASMFSPKVFSTKKCSVSLCGRSAPFRRVR